jgi:transcriptional regulator GlxA family with amidase domain
VSVQAQPSADATRAGHPRRVGVLLFPNVEDLDYAGPLEVFGIAGRLEPGTFEVTTVAEVAALQTRYGVTVQPAHLLESAPHLDVLIVPGGYGTRHEVTNRVLLSWIAARAPQAQVAASVCTGALLLAAAGVLRSGEATTHWASIEELRQNNQELTVRESVRWVDQGAVATSAGVAAGIDLALHLVSRLASAELARRAAHQMEYPWSP